MTGVWNSLTSILVPCRSRTTPLGRDVETLCTHASRTLRCTPILAHRDSPYDDDDVWCKPPRSGLNFHGLYYPACLALALFFNTFQVSLRVRMYDPSAYVRADGLFTIDSTCIPSKLGLYATDLLGFGGGIAKLQAKTLEG